MDRIERIKYMEQLFGKACDMIYSNKADRKDITDIQSVIYKLSDYQSSGLWLSDYTADENSELPKDLKRGVLSQDGLYNLLCENERLLNIYECQVIEKENKMKKVKITAMRKARYDDLIEKYENPILHACDVTEGQVWIANGWQKPDGLCDSAWESMSPFVMTLAHGGENFYDGWMKNPKSAMISCNDGFRPVSFLIETMDEDAD
ncbi:MAG: TIGR04076 family protein [Oscillospiraceae bacterium]|nr:TIGR04076 family protein [Oscillospiraceae bacterium]